MDLKTVWKLVKLAILHFLNCFWYRKSNAKTAWESPITKLPWWTWKIKQINFQVRFNIKLFGSLQININLILDLENENKSLKVFESENEGSSENAFEQPSKQSNKIQRVQKESDNYLTGRVYNSDSIDDFCRAGH